MKRANLIKLMCLVCGFLIYVAAYLTPRVAGMMKEADSISEKAAPVNNLPAVEAGIKQEKKVDFKKDIEPIFQASCSQCHAGVKAKAKLRLDNKVDLMKGGISGPAIIAGKSKESLLMQRVHGEGDGMRMPPGGPLTKAQLDLLTAWIDQGAEWPDESNSTDKAPTSPPVTPPPATQPSANKPPEVQSDNQPGSQTVSFNRDIRPIMSDTCMRCHGPDKGSRMAGLRLDLREEAVKKTKSGIIPIVPGKPDESEIIRRIFAKDESEVMPPKDAHKELTGAQKELFRRWVAEGAKYEGHWAYQPVARPTVPPIPVSASTPIRNPVDAFIQAHLLKEGLTQAPEANRRTLIRRVSLDLTGLPPKPQEVEAFVNDRSPDAYEKIVDRLLNSPRYAEKQAMHWLDAVRYADTAGFHGDNALPAWPYRDYVLRAFRDNKPLNEFAREQIAGDLMPNATTEQRVASAYNRLNRTSAEGGLQPKEYLAKYAADRVRTTSAVWLGSTLGCAECHDHKFDPFPTKDFYSMKAFFADIKETGLVPDRGRDAWGSKLMLPAANQKRRLDQLNGMLAQAQRELEERARSTQDGRAEWEKQLLASREAGELEWKFQRPIAAKSTNGATLKIYNDEPVTMTQPRGGSMITERITGDGLVMASGANPEREIYTVTFKPGAGVWTALGVEVVQDDSLPGNRFARGADRFVLTEVEAVIESPKPKVQSPVSRPRTSDFGLRTQDLRPQTIEFVLATTDGFGQQIENPATAAIDGDRKTGWGVSQNDGRSAFISLRLREKLQTEADSLITVRLRHESDIRRATIGRFRLALSKAEHSWPDHTAKTDKPLRGLPTDVSEALRIPEGKRSEEQKKAVLDFYKWSLPELEPLVVRVARIEAERDMLDAEIPKVVVTESTMPGETRVLPRSNWMDDSGEIVQPAIPVMFGKLDAGNGRRANRLDLANWIVSKDNPLTARVFVNRTWRQFFGTGLSKVLDDVGSQGEWPKHLELLDWLASEFVTPTCGSRNAECGMRNEESAIAVGSNNPRSEVRNPKSNGWNIKHLIRIIVTSHTYRQSSLSNPQLDERDPDNRLLARQSRFRVDAEIVRDVSLAVSGLLVEKFGGPSVKPYQPEGYLASLNFPKRDYSADRGDNLYRRGLYTHWQRSFLHPSLVAFDAPSREECTVNRTNSNTPLQALALLNDPIYTEAARVFAQNILKHGGQTPSGQIDWAIQHALSRKPDANERRVLAALYKKNLLRFQRDPVSAGEFISVGDYPLAKELEATRLAAMTTVARAILNLHETITRN